MKLGIAGDKEHLATTCIQKCKLHIILLFEEKFDLPPQKLKVLVW